MNIVGARAPGQTKKSNTLHELRTRFLESLAILAGYSNNLQSSLPDGRRPDILRLDLDRRRLFIGDAKNSETPNDTEMLVRLLAYCKWMSSFIRTQGSSGIIAICFGECGQAKGWVNTLEYLSQEAGVQQFTAMSEKFDDELFVAWCRCFPPEKVVSRSPKMKNNI